MKRTALRTLSVLLGLAIAGCSDEPTAPEPLRTPRISGPSRTAVHDVGIPAPDLSYGLHEGDLRVTWRWRDDQAWDLVTFELRLDGKKIQGEWNIKPYAQDELGLFPGHLFSWTRPDYGETVPDLCVSVMAKSRAGKGTPATTFHAENCEPVLQALAGSSPLVFQPRTMSAGGSQTTCALGSSGEAYCWGGSFGIPTPIRGGHVFTQLSSGSYHICALATSGAAYCWGSSQYGQLGGGLPVYRVGEHLDPVPVVGGFAFVQVAAGRGHTCALSPGGRAYCWGRDFYGQLGTGFGDRNDKVAPQPVVDAPIFARIAAGGSHTCGLSTEGKAYCWGRNSTGQLGIGTSTWSDYRVAPTAVATELTFTEITAGEDHTCALTASGVAYCWGLNDYGQLGRGPAEPERNDPAAVAGDHVFSQITAGYQHTCALTTTGAAYCWGNNIQGQVGDDTYASRSFAPSAVVGGLDFTQITAGTDHSCAVAESGKSYCWGAAWFRSPSAVSARLATAQLDAGHRHACTVTLAGAVHCWGSNVNGQLGDGSSGTIRSAPTLVQADPWARDIFAQVSAGFDHTCALTRTGRVHCWGLNDSGQLGDGTTTSRAYLQWAVAGSHTFSEIHAGYRHTCGLTTGGAALCWGNNANGQLGDGTVTDRLVPTAVAGGLTFRQLSTGDYHTCGVTSSGAAYCWGYNADGQLGDRTTSRRLNPTVVSGGLSFTGIGAGLYHTCGVTSSGAAYCWGNNPYGQLGDGSTDDRLAPTAVAGGLEFARIAAGGSHSCALTASGGAYCWGRNNTGQLGDGSQTERHTPTAVAGGLTFTGVSAGTDHTCGWVEYPGYWTFPAAYCWGSNAYGQLGVGATASFALTPRAVLTLFRG